MSQRRVGGLTWSCDELCSEPGVGTEGRRAGRGRISRRVRPIAMKRAEETRGRTLEAVRISSGDDIWDEWDEERNTTL
eukprot:388079-Rhodomonas_salina.1